MRAITVEGYVIGIFVILNGIYVIVFPPYGDEAQGYAIAATGLFILLVTWHMTCRCDDGGE